MTDVDDEERVTAIEQLPARIDRLELQFVQFREEVRAEFSSVRQEIRSGDEQLREEMRTGYVVIVTALTEQIEEARRYTRVLFEELVSRISTIHDHLVSRNPNGPGE